MADATYLVTVSLRDYSGDEDAQRDMVVAYGGDDPDTVARRVAACFDAHARAVVVDVREIGPTAGFDPTERYLGRIPGSVDHRTPVKWQRGDGAYLYPAGRDKPIPVRVIGRHFWGRNGRPRVMVAVQPTRTRGAYRTDRLYLVPLDGGRISTHLFARNCVKRGGRAVIHTHDVSALPGLGRADIAAVDH